MRFPAIVTAMLLAAACSSYETRPVGPASAPAPRGQVRPPQSSATAVVLTAAQVALVREYYGGGSANGRDRGRNGGLPPGIARNLERGKSLPPGIARQALPGDLLVRLPVAPGGLEYLVVAGKLVLVEAATQVVRQVLLDAVFG